ncbi:MAG: hypothetical protein JXQ82_02280 [Methanomicrobiaceae archaeon]|nr:hypothetical protein [Methanomicrobiaceae archaeon]
MNEPALSKIKIPACAVMPVLIDMHRFTAFRMIAGKITLNIVLIFKKSYDILAVGLALNILRIYHPPIHRGYNL